MLLTCDRPVESYDAPVEMVVSVPKPKAATFAELERVWNRLYLSHSGISIEEMGDEKRVLIAEDDLYDQQKLFTILSAIEHESLCDFNWDEFCDVVRPARECKETHGHFRWVIDALLSRLRSVCGVPVEVDLWGGRAYLTLGGRHFAHYNPVVLLNCLDAMEGSLDSFSPRRLWQVIAPAKLN